MSADNGVYILKTQGPVWRVAHVQAIENLDFYRKLRPALLDAYLRDTWGSSPRFNSYDDALRHAVIMTADLPLLEYGISEIDITPYKFPGD